MGVEPVLEGLSVGVVNKEAVGNEEVRIGCPRINRVALFLADALDVFAVEDFESEAEAIFEFGLPLIEHRGRAGDDNVLDAFAKEEFGGNEPGFDGFAEADVVGDEEIDAGQAESLAEGLELIGVELDPGSERRLEEAGIGRGDTMPA